MRITHAAVVIVFVLSGCASTNLPAGEHGIAVTGTGHVMARPDTGTIDVGAQARAPQLADASARVDQTMRNVLARIKALGVPDEDIRTTVYQIDPLAEQRAPGDEGARIVGYRVTNVAQVRARDVARFGPIADAAVGAGANIVRNIQLTIEDPSRFEAQARALAMRDAAARAGQVAAAAGVKLGKLLSVRESAPMRPMGRMVMQAAPGPIEAGQMDVSVTVDARYAIE